MENLNSKRVHDSFYAKEDHYTVPKEYFKEAINLINLHSQILNDSKEASILDVGCAAGDFLRYFKSQSKNSQNINLYGIDVMEKLLVEAQNRLQVANFQKCDIGYSKQNLDNIFNTKHDVITMFGVHPIFDDFIWLDNLFTGLKKSGFALLYGIFNPYPYDVILRVKKSGSDNWEPGWNVISKKSVIEYCEKKSYKAYFIDFEPDIDIKPNKSDGLRSWTFDLPTCNELNNSEIPLEQKRKRIFTSANRLIYDWSFCLIRKY